MKKHEFCSTSFWGAMVATFQIVKMVFFTCQLLNKSFGWSAGEKIIPKSCLLDVWNSWTISVKMAKNIPLLPSNFNYFWNLVGNNSFSFIPLATITRKLSDHEGQYLLKVFQKSFSWKVFYLNLSRRASLLSLYRRTMWLFFKMGLLAYTLVVYLMTTQETETKGKNVFE